MGPQEALDVDMALFDQLPWTVDLHIMVRPSLQEMQAHCSQWEPHILHFVGHGGTSNGQPYLLCYEGEETQGKQLFPGDLIYLFKRTVPRLIVLNACRSGQGQAPLPPTNVWLWQTPYTILANDSLTRVYSPSSLCRPTLKGKMQLPSCGNSTVN
jgi:hypothetical protein